MAGIVWRIAGYRGWSDYDGPQDNNVSFEVVMDSRFSKEEVVKIFTERFLERPRIREVVLNAEFVKSITIE